MAYVNPINFEPLQVCVRGLQADGRGSSARAACAA
jgi:hypothetical protein